MRARPWVRGVHIGLPPVLNFGSADLRTRVGLRVLKVGCRRLTDPGLTPG